MIVIPVFTVQYIYTIFFPSAFAHTPIFFLLFTDIPRLYTCSAACKSKCLISEPHFSDLVNQVKHLFGWKCPVDATGQRRMAILLWANRKATVIMICYNQGIQKMISECTAWWTNRAIIHKQSRGGPTDQHTDTEIIFRCGFHDVFEQ